MCLAKDDPKYYRCLGIHRYHVNKETHETFEPDTTQERRFHKPAALCSTTKNALRQARKNAKPRIAQVCAMRTVKGLEPDAPLGPVYRRELWADRRASRGYSILILADRFRKVAEEECVPAAEVAHRYEIEQVIPYRASAGERLAALVTPEADRPEWCDPDRLVTAIEPPQNGMLGQAYCRIVSDLDGKEFVMVTSHDGSEPEAFANDQAGLMAAMDATLSRVRATADVDLDADADGYMNPYTQSLSDADFLSLSDGMHLA